MRSHTDDVYLMMTFARRPLFLKVDSTPAAVSLAVHYFLLIFTIPNLNYSLINNSISYIHTNVHISI